MSVFVERMGEVVGVDAARELVELLSGSEYDEVTAFIVVCAGHGTLYKTCRRWLVGLASADTVDRRLKALRSGGVVAVYPVPSGVRGKQPLRLSVL